VKIKDVQIDGFGVWSGLTVDSMPDTMTVFYGPNEAGKTTLMQFLRTMFYGFTADRRQRYIPPVYGGKPGGAIRVTGPGGGYEITRRSQLDQNGTAGHLTVTGSDGLSQGQHRLAMLLGQVDESIFTNVFAIGLRELQELSTLDDTAAADELYKLSSGLDRVSLVDVTRQLKAARQLIVGPTPEHGQMQQLMLKREKLRDEIDNLTGHGRRWSELAALRSTQNAELEDLKQRIAQWELEARTYEVALQVRPNWQQRAKLTQQIKELNARTELPDSAAEKLAELSKEIKEREKKFAEFRQQRKELREQARNLPLRSGILELAAKIEAANEQSPWITSIQKNIQRLESQLAQTREQLVEDAKRLGISEEDQQALLGDRRMARMPDLSRQAITQLAGPARDVRMYLTRLKQAKQQCEADKKEADRLAKELAGTLATRQHDNLHDAMQSTGDLIGILRKRLHIQESLDKHLALREQLEEEAIDLAADEALPVERSFVMGLVFVGGTFAALWGAGKLLGWFATKDPQGGLLLLFLGIFLNFIWFTWGNMLDRNTVTDLEDVEDQLEAIKKEIRKTEVERDEFERRLPPHTGTLESRLRDAEGEVGDLERLLPLQHNHQAAVERQAAARKRGQQAAESLRIARSQWTKTLAHLGLTESLSPKSIRIMAEGYESLTQTRKRMQSLEEELDIRKIELGALTQRIDALSRQAFAAKAASDTIAGSERPRYEDDEFEEVPAAKKDRRDDRPHDRRDDDRNRQQPKRQPLAAGPQSPEPVRAGSDAASIALEQLAKLTSLISSQEQFIQQKKSMREQDQQHAKHQAAVEKAIDKLNRMHSAKLAELGCESEEQLLEMLELKHEHEKLQKQLAEFNERIRAVIGGSIPYEGIARLLDGAGADDLEKRWDAIQQRTQQAVARVGQLHQRQGELGQEMKSLAGDSRLAEAKLELVCLENQLKACANHWQTLAATTNLLDKVCEVYETERQPETLREASAFLSQLTDGKYVRVWTPLGKNQLRIDNATGQALPLEVLSRGTREAVFISLRLSLAAAYARRGVTLPLVLDDVLVNFDTVRAESAAKVLRDFATLGHQVVMFTCHEHIMRIFHEIGVQVRVLPPQGQPGEAIVYYPENPIVEQPILEQAAPLERIVYVPAPEPVREPVAEVIPAVIAPVPQPLPIAQAPAPLPKAEAVPKVEESPVAAPPPIQRIVVVEHEPHIDWLWYEQNDEDIETNMDLGWVESEDFPDEKLPPPDLWWHRVARTDSTSAIVD
jgi:uncharacterized protein YhaN